MTPEQKQIADLIAKDQIRDLVLLYSRGVDRQDLALLATLYASDATDRHGDHFAGSAADYIAFLAAGLPHVRYSGHHVCNHLISVDGDVGEGEVYALAYHAYADGRGGMVEDVKAVRYIDRYRKEDGRWLFASRVVAFDYESIRPASPMSEIPEAAEDASYAALTSRIFARGPRS